MNSVKDENEDESRRRIRRNVATLIAVVILVILGYLAFGHLKVGFDSLVKTATGF